MYKKILIPTDGSEKVKNTVSKLASVFSNIDGEIILLAVAEKITPHHFQSKKKIKSLNEVILEDAKEDAEDLKNLFDEDFNVNIIVRTGRPADVINEVAEEEDIDLIVIPKSGKSSLDKFRLGSVTGKVVSNSNTDVLVVT